MGFSGLTHKHYVQAPVERYIFQVHNIDKINRTPQTTDTQPFPNLWPGKVDQSSLFDRLPIRTDFVVYTAVKRIIVFLQLCRLKKRCTSKKGLQLHIVRPILGVPLLTVK